METLKIKTQEEQNTTIKNFKAGNGITFTNERDEVIISSQGGGGGTDIEVMQIVPDTNLQVLYADGLATFSGMIANLKNGDNPVSVPAEIELPIKAGDNVVIDASEDDKYLIVKTENAGGGGVHTITADENTIASQLRTLYEQGKSILYVNADVNFQNNQFTMQTLRFEKATGAETVEVKYQDGTFSPSGQYFHGISTSSNVIQFTSISGQQIEFAFNGIGEEQDRVSLFIREYNYSPNAFNVFAGEGDDLMISSTFTIYYLDSAN